MNEEIIDHLTDLGLSGYEAQAYVTLFQNGPETANQIATNSEVPKGRIYDVLNSLQEQSLIRSDDERPKSYTTVGPTQTVDRLLETCLCRLDEQRTDYEQRAGMLKESLSSLEVAESDSAFSTSAFHHDDARELLLDRFQAANKSIRIVGNAATTRMVDRETEEFNESILSTLEDVEAKLLITNQTEWATELTDLGVAVRIADPNQTSEHRFVVIDNTEVCIEIVRPTSPDQLLAVINFRNDQPVQDLTETFESLWKAATPVTKSDNEADTNEH